MTADGRTPAVPPTPLDSGRRSRSRRCPTTLRRMSQLVTVDLVGNILMIGINRAEKRNAFNLAVIDQFAAAYQQLADEPAARVGVVYGHGDHFSAGLDLAEVGPVVASQGAQTLAGDHEYDPFGIWKPQVPKPVVLALNGLSYTLSIELALASDIVVAADDVRLRQLEIGRGLMPFGGGTFRGPAQLGWGNAMRFLLTGEEFGAAYAEKIGLVQEVVPAGEHVNRARQIAELIAEQSPMAVQATLANARIGRDGGEGAAVAHILSTLPQILASEDAAEGLQSFIERRPAKF